MGPALLLAAPALADAAIDQDVDLSKRDLEPRGQGQPTAVSRRPECVRDAAAPVSVIPREEVRRSGVQFLPEALRLANEIGRRVQAGLRWTW